MDLGAPNSAPDDRLNFAARNRDSRVVNRVRTLPNGLGKLIALKRLSDLTRTNIKFSAAQS